MIVESPTKAKTINKYLGKDYYVMSSVGHVRDLPSRNPKGVKNPVPGVDLENDFQPTYDIMPDKKKIITDLKKAAKLAKDVWFATDLDREGEAIAWHLAEALSVNISTAKRVVFNAITKAEIENAFNKPRNIDVSRVNAQQARRILDRIVGYQVSPLLWKKVAGGLSAGRVQSVAVRLVVEREAEIQAFVPDEYWKIAGYFTVDTANQVKLTEEWATFLTGDEIGNPRTIKDKVAWLNTNQSMSAELTHVNGKAFNADNEKQALDAASLIGFVLDSKEATEDPKGKGPAKNIIKCTGHASGDVTYAIDSIKTKRTSSRPGAPFITSTLQQAASTRLGFPLKRTMSVAQELYQGVNLKGALGQTGLITYMRTDSTHITKEAITMARDYVQKECGDNYLPEKPNFYSSSNKSAQEAHEAIRPTDATLTPESIKHALSDQQYKLYKIIWQRFLASQMLPAQWDSTTVLIGAQNNDIEATFKTTGRTLVFDGFYKITGVPNSGDMAILPPLEETQPVAPIQYDPSQHFTSPPPRYTEASLQKKLEEEGIGRPSTYAAIIGTIQDRKYVEQVAPRDRRLMASDLGIAVTEFLIEVFPQLMNLAYTREMESELDKIEEENHDWIKMLHHFYDPFKICLDDGYTKEHKKQELQPAPHKCEKCGASTVYRLGKNGKFLSCSTYPDCKYAAPIDREGNPLKALVSDIACPNCQKVMTKRTGRFGPFLGCIDYPTCKGIVNIDPKKGTVKLPKPPPMLIDLTCPKCDSQLNMRRSKRGPWLSCSKFPKCRGRLGWSAVEEDQKEGLELKLEQHEKDNPVPDVCTIQGVVIDDEYIPLVEEMADKPETKTDEKPAA